MSTWEENVKMILRLVSAAAVSSLSCRGPGPHHVKCKWALLALILKLCDVSFSFLGSRLGLLETYFPSSEQ